MNILFKRIIYSLLFIAPFWGNAQLKHVYDEMKRINFNIPVKEKTGWETSTEISINANQASYNNWQGGANNKIGIEGVLNQKVFYQGDQYVWDNYFIIEHGINKIENQEFRKTQDRIELNSLIGWKLPGKWSASFFTNLQTQMLNSYNYNEDAENKYRINGLAAPLYTTIGPGILWRKDKKLNFNLAPVTCKITYINGEIFLYNEKEDIFQSSNDVNVLGVDAGKHINLQLGFYSSAFYEWQITKNIKLENRLSLYSNYLDKPANIDLDYTMHLNLGINDILSTQITLQARYDDDAYKGLQGRESIGVGFKFKI